MGRLWFAVVMTVYYPLRSVQAHLGFPIDMDGYRWELRRAWRELF